MTRRLIYSILISCVMLTSCGYTTHSVSSGKQQSIHIKNFVNKIDVTEETTDDKVFYAYRPGMESSITRAVINRYLFDGNYEIKSLEKADFVLQGELLDFTREPLRYDANDNVIEYRIRTVVNIELYDEKTGDLVWKERSFAGESTYRTSGQYAKSESVATTESIEDLARRIVERTVENW
jgi:hypothetical protein